MAEYEKPLPLLDEESKPFWEGARRHELLIQRCKDCGRAYFPASYCSSCNSDNMEWVKASGRGKVFSFAVYHYAYHPGFKGDIPYNVAYIELEEGPLILSSIMGCEGKDIEVGMPVEVVFEDVSKEFSLPKFKPVSQG